MERERSWPVGFHGDEAVGLVTAIAESAIVVTSRETMRCHGSEVRHRNT